MTKKIEPKQGVCCYLPLAENQWFRSYSRMWSQAGHRKHQYEQSGWRWGIPVELFQILKDDAVKVLYSTCHQIWKTQRWPQEWKRSVFILISKKGNAKECLNTAQLHSSSTLIKSYSKFSKPGFSNTWTVKFLMFKLVLEKAEEPGIKLPTSTGSWKKQESSRKTSISALLTMPKPLTV